MTVGKAIVGVDVGGTFTDLFLFDAAARTFKTAKVPSNRGNEAAGFMAGLEALGDVGAFGSIGKMRAEKRLPWSCSSSAGSRIWWRNCSYT